MIGFFAAQAAAALVGAVVLLVLQTRAPLGLFLPGAWLAGTGALAVERLVLAQVGVPWTSWVLALPWVVGAFLVRGRWHWRPRVPGLLGVAVIAVIVAWMGTMFWQATNQPLVGWDAWAMWFLKGRALYQSGGLPPGFFSDPFFAAYAHLDYPLLVPLTIAGTYAWMGDVDTLMKGWWPLLAGAAACGLYFGVEGRMARLGGLILLLGLPEVWRHTVGDYVGYADLPLAVLVLFGGLFLWRRQYLTAALFFGLAGFTKNEGLVVAAAGAGIAVVMGRSCWPGVIAAVVVLPWQWQMRVFSLAPELAGGSVQWERVGVVWEALGLWVVFAPLLFALNRPVTLVLVAQLGAAFIAYLMTPNDVQWHLRTSADRVVFQAVPLAVLLASFGLGRLLESSDAARTGA